MLSHANHAARGSPEQTPDSFALTLLLSYELCQLCGAKLCQCLSRCPCAEQKLGSLAARVALPELSGAVIKSGIIPPGGFRRLHVTGQ